MGRKEEIITCDRCGKESARGESTDEQGVFFRVLFSGDFCSLCLRQVDADASHAWFALNHRDGFLKRVFITEPRSIPPSHLDSCSNCGEYRRLWKEGDEIKAAYYHLGSKLPSVVARACSGKREMRMDSCTHDYVKILSTERTPDASELRGASKASRQMNSNPIVQAFGFTDRDLAASTFGEAFFWCSKCGHARCITRGQILPRYGVDKNFGDRYQT